MNSTHLFFNILFSILIGVLTAYLAKQRGREPVNWFFIGSILGIFGFILLFLMPKLNVEGEEENQKPDAPQEVPLIPPEETKEWYYLDQARQQKGPFTFHEMKSCIQNQEIGLDNYIWSEGMPDWKKLKDLPNKQVFL